MLHMESSIIIKSYAYLHLACDDFTITMVVRKTYHNLLSHSFSKYHVNNIDVMTIQLHRELTSLFS